MAMMAWQMMEMTNPENAIGDTVSAIQS